MYSLKRKPWFHRFIGYISVLGLFSTMTWHILRSWMAKMTARCGGELQVYWISSCRHPTCGDHWLWVWVWADIPPTPTETNMVQIVLQDICALKLVNITGRDNKISEKQCKLQNK